MKPWYKSNIIRLNILGAAIDIANVLGGYNLVPTGTVSIVINVLTIIFRVMSAGDKITLKKIQ